MTSAAATAILVLLVRAYGQPAVQPSRGATWLFAFFVLLGELVPVHVLRRGDGGETTIATPFALGLLVTAGVVDATVILAASTVVAGMVRQKPWGELAASAARYGLGLAAAGAAFELLHGRTFDSFGRVDELLAITLAAGVFFLVEHTLRARHLALTRGGTVADRLRRDAAFQLAIVASQLAMTPVAALAAQRSVWMVPLLLVPAVAVHRSANLSLEREQEALHDPLTRLPNRGLFHLRVEEALEVADGPVAVLFLDLDRLREVNDTLGHHIGDRLLQQVGPRLRAVLGPAVTVGRIGGDEFAVLLPGVRDGRHAVRTADALAAAVAEPFRVKELSLAVEANIGVAVYPDHADDAAELMQRADVALYVAKERRSPTELYDADRGARSRRSLSLVGDLRRGIDRRELVLHYQPKAELATSRIVGVEALVRWNHPDHGLVRPDEFIPLAEHTVLMDPLTMWVLDEALSQCAIWREAGLDLRMAVNLSVRNLHDPQLAAKVAGRLHARGLPPSCLELEITESSIMAEPTRAVETLSQLARLGVRLSVDDFGTGYSSLAYLKRLPVQEVKIDRSFISEMATDANDTAIVRSAIELSRHLGLEVVAEGVETRETWEALAELGCHYAQGDYLSSPLPPAEAIRALRGPVLAARGDAGADGA
ncbi:MAG TPA: bifunctional diguanylate cyclase/phosphodiesterase [Egibacteraceae bacterium]|nr:bifunctional diguanylate cyclase/phosphodiesterase [Egibacteraceae bacterium]